MNNNFFTFRVCSVEQRPASTNLHISAPIDRQKVNKQIKDSLNKMGLTTDVSALNFIVRDSNLYAEGWAYPIPEKVVMPLYFS